MWFCLLLFVNEGYWLGYLRRKMAEGKPAFIQSALQRVCKLDLRLYIAGILCLVFICFVVKVEDRLFDYSSYAAYVSLKAGEAQTYDREYWERVEILNGPEKNVTLKAFSVKPWLLYFDDITEDATDWRNGAVANWYYKDSVVLEE